MVVEPVAVTSVHDPSVIPSIDPVVLFVAVTQEIDAQRLVVDERVNVGHVAVQPAVNVGGE